MIDGEKQDGLEVNSALAQSLQDKLHTAQRAQAQYEKQQADAAGRQSKQEADAAKAAQEQANEAQLRGLQVITNAAERGTQARVDAARNEAAYTAATWGESSAQYKEAANRKVEAEREAQAQIRELQRMRQENDQRIADLGVQTEKGRLDGEVAAGRITEAEKLAQIRDLTEQSQIAALQRLDAEISSLNAGDKAWQEAMERRRLLVAQQAADTSRINQDIARQQDADAKKSAQSWASAWQPAEQAIDSTTRGVLEGTQTAGQAVARAGANMAASYIGNMVKMLAEFLLFKAANLMGWTQMSNGLQDSITKGGGAWLLGERAKTAGSQLGTTQRIGLQNMETTTTTAEKTAQVGVTTAVEGAKTAATAAGAGARTTAEEAAALTTKATNTETAVASIGAKAADAAAGAYNAMADIPVVGPVLGAAAAATTFAAVMAYSTIASAEGGWGEVPFDGAPAILHKREMVLPARYADPLRSLLTDGPSSAGSGAQPNSGGGDTHNWNVQAIDVKSFHSFIKGGGGDVIVQHLQNKRRNFGM